MIRKKKMLILLVFLTLVASIWSCTLKQRSDEKTDIQLESIPLIVNKDSVSVTEISEGYHTSEAVILKEGKPQAEVNHTQRGDGSFSVELELEKTPMLNEPVRLTCILISPSEDIIARAWVRFQCPGIMTELQLRDMLIAGDLNWEGAIKEDTPVQFSAIVKFPVPGDWKVSLGAEGYGDGRRHYSRYDVVSLQIPGVTFNIETPDKVASGAEFTARVNITEVANLDSYQLDIAYDSTVIEVIGTEGGTEGVTPGMIDSTGIPVDTWELSPTEGQGTIKVAGTVPGDAGVTGSGYLAEIHFRAVGTAGSSGDISVSARQLYDSAGDEIMPTAYIGDSVQVSPRVVVNVDTPNKMSEDSEFVARVNISRVENLDAYNYDIIYDPAVVEVIGVTDGMIDGTVFPVVAWNFIPLGQQGKIRVVGNIPGVHGVSGSGYLAEIHFRVVGSRDSTSDIAISNGMLGNNVAEEIPVTEWLGRYANID